MLGVKKTCNLSVHNKQIEIGAPTLAHNEGDKGGED